jgi:uncharacterized protein (TIGR00251 family)
LPSSSADAALPWRRIGVDGTITLTIHAQPGAKRTEVSGAHGGALKIRIASPPVEGKANEALRSFLAEAFGVPKRNVALLRGDSARRKTVSITSPALRPDRVWAALRDV